jgi:predicted RNase H-like nuclease
VTRLLIGFDSAWTPGNSGALVGALEYDGRGYQSLGIPQIVEFQQATRLILKWLEDYAPAATIILLDQPTIVHNATGQRDVENIVASPVSRRYGGVQPANTSRVDMFGPQAPVWTFLNQFGGAADPLAPVKKVAVLETYPVLAMISLGWTIADTGQHSRPSGRLPKYNPQRRKTFSSADWEFVCNLTSEQFRLRGLSEVAMWIENVAQKASPRKHDQDGLDALLCLLVAFTLAERRSALMVGNLRSGYIVVPHSKSLHAELTSRCHETGRDPDAWVRQFRIAQ